MDVEGTSLAASLRALSKGFGASDNSPHVECVLQQWFDRIGPLTEDATRGVQTIRFRSEVPLRVRGMGAVPVLVLGEDSGPARAEVSKLVRETAPGAVVGIILCLTDSAFRYLRWTAALPPGRCLILSRDDVQHVLSDSNAIGRLRRLLLKQIPYRRLIPFSTSEPAEGAIFVGRARELQMLIEENQDFALCGPGGIGKTSVIRQMQWTVWCDRHPRHGRIVEVSLISCEGNLDAAAREIASRISPTKFAHELEYTGLEAFFRRIKSQDVRFSNGPIDLVLDEVDSVLSTDRRMRIPSAKYGALKVSGTYVRYPFLRILRHARHQGLIRLTLSGRTETEELLSDPENPFVVDSARGLQSASRIKLLKIEPLPQSEAEELLLKPLQDLGYPVDQERENLLEKLRECRGIPFDIQDLGLDLVNAHCDSQAFAPQAI